MRGNNPSGSFSIFKYARATLLQLQKYSSDGEWSQNAGEVGPFQVSCPTRLSLSLNCIDQLDVIYRHPEKKQSYYILVLTPPGAETMPQRHLQLFQLDS